MPPDTLSKLAWIEIGAVSIFQNLHDYILCMIMLIFRPLGIGESLTIRITTSGSETMFRKLC